MKTGTPGAVGSAGPSSGQGARPVRRGHGRRACADSGLHPTKNDRRLQFGKRRYVLDGCGGTQPLVQTLFGNGAASRVHESLSGCRGKGAEEVLVTTLRIRG